MVMRTDEIDSIVNEAMGGNARRAVRTACFLHNRRETNDYWNYGALLEAALRSTDAELMCWIAENLLEGKRLRRDHALAAKFLKRADEISGFMGTFIEAMWLIKLDRNAAYLLFLRCSKFGHIPSFAMMQRIWYSDHTHIASFFKPFFVVVGSIRTLYAIKRPDAAKRFWKYGEVFDAPPPPLISPFVKLPSSPLEDDGDDQIAM